MSSISESSKANIDTETIWAEFLESVRPRLSQHVYRTWLEPIRPHSLNHATRTLTLEVHDDFARDWLKDHYLDFISETLAEQLEMPIHIELQVNPDLRNELLAQENDAPPTSASPAPADAKHAKGEVTGRPLNPRYLFDTFVSGPSNQLAFAASRAVAENPANSYNPLFLFGGTGLGKTHLLCAIGHQILTDQPDKRVIYISSEQFMNEVVNAVRYSRIDEFHHKYRSRCDVLLIDDIQLLAGKDRTQHEFFHIFNTMYDSMRQMVVTSDKLPHEMPEIEERLRTRFQWGLIADIQPPEIETRIAILQKKADSENIELPDNVAIFLAQNVRSNVRELEGALVRVMAHASLTNRPITVDYARDVLGDLLVSKAQQISVDGIQKMVASYYQVKVSDLKSKRRLKTFVRPRQVAMYLCRKHGNASFPELGSQFGNKDHTTIMSACKKIDELLRKDASLRNQIQELERELDK